MGDRLSWVDLLRIADYSPRSSALRREADPDVWITPEIQLLREIEFRSRVLTWQATEDGHKGRNVPTPLPMTAAEVEAATPEREKYDHMSIEEANAFLGWTTDEHGQVVTAGA